VRLVLHVLVFRASRNKKGGPAAAPL
jgi:hypothetical protein